MINVGGKCPWELSWRNVLGEGNVRDVRDQWPDTVPEWHKRNLVTLVGTKTWKSPEPYTSLHIFDQPQIQITWTPAWVVGEVQSCCQQCVAGACRSEVLQSAHEAADDPAGIVSCGRRWSSLPACLQLGPHVCEQVSWRRIQAKVPESDSEASSEDHLVLHGS